MVVLEAVNEDRSLRNGGVPSILGAQLDQEAAGKLCREQPREILPNEGSELDRCVEAGSVSFPHPRLVQPAAAAHVPRVEQRPDQSEFGMRSHEYICPGTHDIPSISVI